MWSVCGTERDRPSRRQGPQPTSPSSAPEDLRRVYHGPVDALKVIVAWGAFALFPSVTVSGPYERWARGFLGDERFRAYHRLLFTLYSAAATAPVLLYLRSLPDVPLFRLDGWARILFHGVQILG